MKEYDSNIKTDDCTPSEPANNRNRFWDNWGGPSLTIAFFLHAIVLILGAYWVFQVTRIPDKADPSFIQRGGGDDGERAANTNVKPNRLRTITPTSNPMRVFVNGATSSYIIPDQSDKFAEISPLPSMESGSPSGLGGPGKGRAHGPGDGNRPGTIQGIGNGKMPFGVLPTVLGGRCTMEDRLQRIKENGGNPQCEEAVIKGLRWIKGNQKPDGSFADGDYKVAMTGLALLAYFGHCETPLSEEFGDSCTKGIGFLVNIGMKNDGRLASNYAQPCWSYEHAIATYALGEALTFSKDSKSEIPYLREITEKAGQFIIDNQNVDNGWAYSYALSGGHTDLSVAGWQIQALRAVSHTDIKFHGLTKAIDLGLKYTNSHQDKSGGYGYANTNLSGGLDYYTLTGVGMLCNQMWGKGNRPEVNKGAKYLLENSKFEYNGEYADLYGHYYESQAMMQKGGDDWKRYNTMFRDQLLNNQNTDGSWKAPGGGQKIRAVAGVYASNDMYRTCLCTLMMEVYYRFLSTGGGIRTTRQSLL